MKKTVELFNISKNFGGVKALTDVSIKALAGEVLALVGENGAGKSTLMNILSGVYPFGNYQGQIHIDGNEQKFSSPLDAEKSGITIIHQELSSFPELTVAENMWVGHWPKEKGLVSWSKMTEHANKWLGNLGVSLNPQATMRELSTGSQQLVEIAKALAKQSHLIIFDEPTSSLTPKECDTLFKIINQLRKDGKAIVYISHKMEEVFSLADRITVLRDGKSVFTGLAKEISTQDVIKHMVGRSLDRMFPELPNRESFKSSNAILTVKDLKISRSDSAYDIGPISFEVRPGEILGFSGLLGAGRSELAHAIYGRTGANFKVEGQVKFKGKDYVSRSPRESVRLGLTLVGEDRKEDSIFAIRSLNENVSISRLISKSIAKFLRLNSESEQTNTSLKTLSTRFSNQEQFIKELSGGNQQKVVLSRILQTTPDLIILDEPTRGVDVGAKFEIYQILFQMAAQGKALIVISSDLPELMGLSDRILVLSEGKLVGELPKREQFTQTKIMEMAVQA